MDTDSAYMAVTAPLEDIVRPEMRSEFYAEYGEWFPRPYCEAHATEFVAPECLRRAGVVRRAARKPSGMICVHPDYSKRSLSAKE